jgi:hypothetical protein
VTLSNKNSDGIPQGYRHYFFYLNRVLHLLI